MAVDETALDAFLADPATPGGDLNPDGLASAGAAAASAPAAPAAAAAVEVAIPSAEPATPTADAKVEAAIAATGQTEDKWDPETRKYIEELRDESGKYRKRGQRYNDVFDGYEDDAVNEWLDLASTLKSDPKAAAERFQQIAQAIQDQYEAEAAAEVVNHAEQDMPLTKAEFNRLMSEREAANETTRLVAQIEIDATKLGYTLQSDDYNELLFVASNIPSGSIQEAHAKIEARNQAIFDRKVKEMGLTPAPTVPNPNGGPASGEVKLKTFAAANEALDAWLAGQA